MPRSVLAINMIVTLKNAISIAMVPAIQTVKKLFICRGKGSVKTAKNKTIMISISLVFNETG